jgi:hypothetical protein
VIKAIEEDLERDDYWKHKPNNKAFCKNNWATCVWALQTSC